MINSDISRIKTMVENPNNIRNIAIISDESQEESTLINRVISLTQLEFKSKTETNTEENKEKEEVKLKKSVNTSLQYEYGSDLEANKSSYLINLVSFKNGAFYLEPNPTFKLIDGVVLEVDFIEGITLQTEKMLRQALIEKVKPVLIIKNVYRHTFEAQKDPEAVYRRLCEVIEGVNLIISTYDSLNNNDLLINPRKGNVIFLINDSGPWGFTLTKFAHLYAKKLGVDPGELAGKFWENNYFDPETKSWIKNETTENGKTLERGFVHFIMEPIMKLSKSISNQDEGLLSDILKSIEIELLPAERELKGEQLLNMILSKWLDAVDCFMEMIILHLPSSKLAQKQRSNHLYEGSSDDPCYQSMKECNPKGPLLGYILKMVPTTSKDIFFAFGKVYSGTIFVGQNIRMMGPNYIPKRKSDLMVRKIDEIILINGTSVTFVDEVPAGNVFGLVFKDKNFFVNCTISDHEDARNIRTSKFSLSPIVKVSVEPKIPADLPKLLEGLNKLAKCDPFISVTEESTGQHIIAGYNEVQIENSLRDLKNEYADCEVKESEIQIAFKETVSTKSPVCLSKSANKHNRFYCTAEPLPETLIELIENGEIGPNGDPKLRTKRLNQQFDFDLYSADRLWAFGPENCGPNIVIDSTKGVQYLNEIKDSVQSGFQWVTKEGVLCEENMRGVRIDIVDVAMFSDAIHRGGGQVIPTFRRVCYACELTAQPRLQEPIFFYQINTPTDLLGNLYQALNQRRAVMIEEQTISNTSLTQVKFYLPLAESIGFSSLKLNDQSVSCSFFSHWEVIPSDPLDLSSSAHEIIAKVRKRKGLKEGIPELSNFLDKL